MNNQERRRWWALGALALSVLVVGLDLTVLNLALPTLGTDLHASTSDLQWFVDSYSLVLAAAILPAGLLGDRLGRKKILVPALCCSAWRRWPARTPIPPANSSPPAPSSASAQR
jgi:DHA2 family multidrug resistance protein-like MFS transporter